MPTRRECALLAGLLTVMLVASAGWTVSAPPRDVTSTQSKLLIDPNRADLYELVLLEGIGETTALKIIAERETNGPFSTIEDLQRVKGIGPKTVERLRGALTFGVEAEAPVLISGVAKAR